MLTYDWTKNGEQVSEGTYQGECTCEENVRFIPTIFVRQFIYDYVFLILSSRPLHGLDWSHALFGRLLRNCRSWLKNGEEGQRDQEAHDAHNVAEELG